MRLELGSEDMRTRKFGLQFPYSFVVEGSKGPLEFRR